MPILPGSSRAWQVEVELNFGISFEVYSMMSAQIRIEGVGG